MKTSLLPLLLSLTALSGIQAAATGDPALLGRAECSVTKRDDLEDSSGGNHTSVIEKRQYDGTCDFGNQICPYSWRTGNFICKSYCHCSPTSQCTRTGNYCFIGNNGAGSCICT